FGTKCPSITSQWSTVPPPSSAAFASSASRAKFAESIDGASSMVMGPGPLLPTSEKRDYTRKFFVLLKSDIRTKFRTSPRNRAALYQKHRRRRRFLVRFERRPSRLPANRKERKRGRSGAARCRIGFRCPDERSLARLRA